MLRKPKIAVPVILGPDGASDVRDVVQEACAACGQPPQAGEILQLHEVEGVLMMLCLQSPACNRRSGVMSR